MTSIIIRTKNEGLIFREVLQALRDQTNQDFEVVQVDDNSEDGTQNLIFDYFPKSRAKVVNIPPGKFSHPYSSNLGCQNSCGKYLVFINGHSVPISKTWLEDGLASFKQNPKTAGLYGLWKARSSDTFWDRFFINRYLPIQNFILYKGRKRAEVTRFVPGLLQTTNAILLKELWDKQKFNEERGMGGEDTEWALYWIKKGYVIIMDQKFNVYHAHGLNLKGWWRELKFWHSLIKPTPFDPATYRFGAKS